MKKRTTEEIKQSIRQKREKPIEGKGLSTGCTLLNLACTGDPNYGLLGGNYYLLVGDSSSGKSFLSLTCLAEAVRNPDFKNHRFIFDNAENGALMDIDRFFGSKVHNKLEPPSGTRDDPNYSSTLEEFYYNVDSAFNENKPFIYILDSMDALAPQDDIDKFDENKAAHEKGKDPAATYGTAKAKLNSSYMRIVFNKLRKEGKSILIAISQTRANIGINAVFNPKTRGGGLSLTFYAALEIWSSVAGHVKTKVAGKDLEQGIYCKMRIKKNRISGKDRTVEFPILWQHGIDDLGGMVDYLVEWKHWPEKEKKISATEFQFTGKREPLIEKILEEELEDDLRRIVTKVWNGIEKQCEVKRKSRYD